MHVIEHKFPFPKKNIQQEQQEEQQKLRHVCLFEMKWKKMSKIFCETNTSELGTYNIESKKTHKCTCEKLYGDLSKFRANMVQIQVKCVCIVVYSINK